MAGSGRRTIRSNRNTTRASRQSRAKRRNQTRKPRPNKKRSDGRQRRILPTLFWSICSLALATAAAAVAYIVIQPTGTEAGVAHPNGTRGITPAKNLSDQQSKAQAKAGPDTKAGTQKPRFKFYQMLPNYHATIDQSGNASSPSNASTSKPKSPPKRQNNSASSSGTGQSHNVEVGGNGPWRIQAGAFSTRDAAQRRVAQLALAGADNARISKQKLDSGKTIYRVRIRSIKSKKHLNKLRSKLKAKHINVMVKNLGS